jgi:hypothetical protein
MHHFLLKSKLIGIDRRKMMRLQGVSLLYGEEEVADFCLDPSTSSGRSGSVGGSGGDYECNVSS